MSHFDGDTYEAELDHDRLTRQIDRIRSVMLDGKWRTLYEIAAATSDPEQSISARLRDFRKLKFGSWTVERQRRGEPKEGVFEYRLLPSQGEAGEPQQKVLPLLAQLREGTASPEQVRCVLLALRDWWKGRATTLYPAMHIESLLKELSE